MPSRLINQAVTLVTLPMGNKLWSCRQDEREAAIALSILQFSGHQDWTASFRQTSTESGEAQMPNVGRAVVLGAVSRTAAATNSTVEATEIKTSPVTGIHPSQTLVASQLLYGRNMEAQGPVENKAAENKGQLKDMENAVQPMETDPEPNQSNVCPKETLEAAQILASMMVERKRRDRMREAEKENAKAKDGIVKRDQPMSPTDEPGAAANNAPIAGADHQGTAAATARIGQIITVPMSAHEAGERVKVKMEEVPAKDGRAQPDQPMAVVNEPGAAATNAPIAAAEQPGTGAASEHTGPLIFRPLTPAEVDDMVISQRDKANKRKQCKFCHCWFENGKDMKRHCNVRCRSEKERFQCPESPKFPIYCPVPTCSRKAYCKNFFSQP